MIRKLSQMGGTVVLSIPWSAVQRTQALIDENEGTNQFLLRLQEKCWIAPINCSGTDTLKDTPNQIYHLHKGKRFTTCKATLMSGAVATIEYLCIIATQ